MLRFSFYTCRLHIFDMFEEMLVMARRGTFKSLFNSRHLYHCYIVILQLRKCHLVLGSDMGSSAKNMAQIPNMRAENSAKCP